MNDLTVKEMAAILEAELDEDEQGQTPFGPDVDQTRHPRWDPVERRILRYDEVEQPRK